MMKTSFTPEQLAKYFDQTLLKAYASDADFAAFCKETAKLFCASSCFPCNMQSAVSQCRSNNESSINYSSYSVSGFDVADF